MTTGTEPTTTAERTAKMRGRVLQNSAWNVFGLVVSMATGLFYTPFLVSQLGVGSFGMVPLITGLFIWVSWLSLSVSWSVGRYVTIAREKGSTEEENRYFNSALVPTLLLSLVVLVLGILLTPFVEKIIRIPPDARQPVQFLWLCSAAVSAMGVLMGVLDVATYTRNRFDIKAMIQIVRTVVMVAVVLLLFRLRGARLEWVGVGAVAASVIGLVLVLVSLRWLLPEVRVQPRLYSQAHFREMIGTNVWILVDQLGTILLLNVDLFLANRFFGPSTSGEYGLATQWVGMLKSVMTAMTVFTPTYILFVARGDINGLAEYALKAARFVGFAMAIPVGMVLGLAAPLTVAWLGRDPGLVTALVVVLTAPLALNAAINPLYGVWQALNKVKVPSFATLGAGFLSIALAIVLSQTTSLGVFGVAVAGGIAFTARNLIFAVWYVGRLLGQGSGRVLLISLRAAIVSSGVAAAGYLLSGWLNPRSWLGVGSVGIVLAVAGAIAVWAVFLNSSERQELAGMLFARSRLARRGKQGQLP